MKTVRILARTLVTDDNKILLVRNKGANFWYPPGGGWEYETETIGECAIREVKEETGYLVTINRMLWMQEFHENNKIFFETFWHATLSDANTQNYNGAVRHVDEDPNGAVEEVRWFEERELAELTVFPKRVKQYATYIAEVAATTDPFIGTFL